MPGDRPRRARWLRASAGVLVGAAALFVALVQANELVLSGPLQSAGHALHRMAFLVTAPALLVSSRISPERGHHWPLVHWALASLLTSVLAFAALAVHRRLRGEPGLLVRIVSSLRRRRATGAAGPPAAAPLSRRELIVGLATATATSAAGGLGLYGTVIEPTSLAVRRYVVRVRGLPASLERLRIAHLSDTHYGPFVPLPFLERAVRTSNELSPDLVLLTGDYVHRTPRAIRDGLGVFGGLRSRLGTLAVLGNHDHWEGASACRGRLRAVGAEIVENRRVFVTREGLSERPPPDGRALCVAGVGDLWEGTVSLEDALGGVPATMPRLLLSHNPDVAETLPDTYRVDLVLSGHTHGGQIRLPWLGTWKVPSDYGDKYAGGMCRGPACDVLVSRGVGMSIMPVRFGVRPEIGLLELRRA